MKFSYLRPREREVIYRHEREETVFEMARDLELPVARVQQILHDALATIYRRGDYYQFEEERQA